MANFNAYTQEEERIVRHLYRIGTPYKDIANALGRSRQSVMQKVSLLGIADRRVPTEDREAAVRKLARQGLTYQEACQKLGIKKSMLIYICQKYGIKFHRKGWKRNEYREQARKEHVRPSLVGNAGDNIVTIEVRGVNAVEVHRDGDDTYELPVVGDIATAVRDLVKLGYNIRFKDYGKK